MTVLTLQTPQQAVVLVSGDLAGEAAEELQDAAVGLISSGAPSLLIHLGRVRSIDGRALRVLLAARQRAELLGGRVLVIRPSAAVREAFSTFGAAHLLQVVD